MFDLFDHVFDLFDHVLNVFDQIIMFDLFGHGHELIYMIIYSICLITGSIFEHTLFIITFLRIHYKLLMTLLRDCLDNLQSRDSAFNTAFES